MSMSMVYCIGMFDILCHTHTSPFDSIKKQKQIAHTQPHNVSILSQKWQLSTAAQLSGDAEEGALNSRMLSTSCTFFMCLIIHAQHTHIFKALNKGNIYIVFFLGHLLHVEVEDQSVG